MIDPHCHLRDWNQLKKETVKHGLMVAYRAGLDGVFEMPNTDPALTSRGKIEERIELADKAVKELRIKIFHGLYAGITADEKQIEEVVKAYDELFPRVVGLKMFAGHSTGNMGLIKEEEQRLVYKTLAKLGYKGVLAVHCEKESKLKDLFDPLKPFTHTIARPPEAEVESVKDQIEFADEAGFKGRLHICHASVPGTLNYIEKMRNNIDYRITCELTPHHAMFYNEMMKEKNGLLLKMNPPLRPKDMKEYVLQALINGRIDFIATDHAPHTLEDKMTGKKVEGKWKGYASGIPGFPLYPHLIKLLMDKGMHEKMIDDLTHSNIIEVFGLDPKLILDTKRAGNQSKEELKKLLDEYKSIY